LLSFFSSFCSTLHIFFFHFPPSFTVPTVYFVFHSHSPFTVPTSFLKLQFPPFLQYLPVTYISNSLLSYTTYQGLLVPFDFLPFLQCLPTLVGS
jgi:hypothetical protein